MINHLDNIFVLNTKNTTYAFGVTKTGHLEHLYYGKSISARTSHDFDALVEKHLFAPGNTIAYNQDNLNFSLEDAALEMSTLGKGDIREPFAEIIHADGGRTSDFTYVDYRLANGGPDIKTLPCSYGSNSDVERLCIVLKDKYYNLTIELHYCVYEDDDVITRYARLINDSNENISLLRLMSNQLDFMETGYKVTTFTGTWAREMGRTDTVITKGKFVNSSFTGTSSNRANPFVMISRPETTEDVGDCYGSNLVYSGNHYEALEVSSYNKTRFVTGINPQGFCFEIAPGCKFESPEAVMTFSCKGYNQMSQNMHSFIKNHIVRGKYKNAPRPVLLNSWEAAYFNINERKLLRLANRAKLVGVELLVMDDGWFSNRNNDTSSLGDWWVNENKLPHGLSHLSNELKKRGLKFGIWVEPEMVNADSELFRKHPDWALCIPGKSHSEGRNQRILDLCNKEVVDYVIDSMTSAFKSAEIAYVKWDMNRIMSDIYSPSLSSNLQGEVAHRYVMGLFEIIKSLTGKFPDILFEGCASGGNRFDLSMLCYFPQIWASDNTDAVCRVNMMTNYSYGYPMSTVTAHVSNCPNHQTLRLTPLDTRFNVAAFGILGYECNLCDMSIQELKEIRSQISTYKKYRDTFQYGNFYRGRNGNIHEWTVVSENKKTAIGMIMQELVVPNTQFDYYKAQGLKEDSLYHFTGQGERVNIKKFGDLVNIVLPIHIKNGGTLQNIMSKVYKMPGETEDTLAYGNTLMYAGIKLQPAFGGTGYGENVRFFQDFSSRMYFMHAQSTKGSATKDLITTLTAKK